MHDPVRAAGPHNGPGIARQTGMNDWVGIALLLAGWWLLQAWVLPRLGVPT